jgi:hypothetical protein
MRDHLKALAAHFRKNAESHRAHAACHTGLSECAKAMGFYKGDRKDYHAEIASQHEADADRCDKMAEHCTKLAGELPAGAAGSDGKSSNVELNLNGDAAAKIATTVIDTLRKEFGEQVMPTLVKGVIPENPLADAGLTLHARAGGAAVPTDASRIDPQFRNLFVE